MATVFFDPKDYLEHDPAQAASKRKAASLQLRARQRATFCRGMVQVAAEQGFESASIKKAAQLSGLSRATFYRLFESCEACLLEAFERCAQTIFAAVAKAARESKEGCGERLEAGLGELLELLAAEPEVARFVLVEIRVGGPACREAQLRWLERFAGLLVDAGQGGGAPRGEGLARMVAGAMATLLSLRLIESGARSLPEMLEELACVGMLPGYGAAVQASKSFEAATPAPEVGAPKARQKRKAIRPFEGQAQREQLLGAMTKLAGASGYEATRVADVSKHAGLPGYVFYAHFASKEECLLAAFDAAVGRTLAGTKAAMASRPSAPRRGWERWSNRWPSNRRPLGWWQSRSAGWGRAARRATRRRWRPSQDCSPRRAAIGKPRPESRWRGW